MPPERRGHGGREQDPLQVSRITSKLWYRRTDPHTSILERATLLVLRRKDCDS